MTEPSSTRRPIIVVGYDGSPAARCALLRAAQLARPGDRIAVVVAVPLLVQLDDEPAGTGQATQPDMLIAEAAGLLRDRNVDHDEVAVPLEPADALIETARDLKADIIIVGTRGRGRAARTALGSVSTAVLHHAPCDVLVVRPRATGELDDFTDGWPRTVLVGYDGSPWARRALERSSDLVRGDGAVRAVFAHPARAKRDRLDDVRASMLEARDRFARQGLPLEALEREGEAAAVIIDAAKKCDADLVVIGSRSRGRAARLILGSVSTAVVHGATQDVLVIR